MAAFVGEGLPNSKSAMPRSTDLLVKTPNLGRRWQDARRSPAALMRGHGSVTVGESLPRAVGRSIYLETSARMQLQRSRSRARGQDTYLDDQEVRAFPSESDYKRAWPMWRLKACPA